MAKIAALPWARLAVSFIFLSYEKHDPREDPSYIICTKGEKAGAVGVYTRRQEQHGGVQGKEQYEIYLF